MNPDGLTKIADLAKSQDFYKSPLNINTSTSSDWSIKSWLWYGGIALLSLGALYLGYKFYENPFWWQATIPNNPEIFEVPPTPPVDPAGLQGNAPITEEIVDNAHAGVAETISGAVAYLGSGLNNTKKALFNAINPFSYFTSEAEIGKNFKVFMAKQCNELTADHRYYPFTVVNPHDSWLTKLRIAAFGESSAEVAKRFAYREAASNTYLAIQVNNEAIVADLAANSHSGYVPSPNAWRSGATTPMPATTLGLGVNSSNNLGHDNLLNVLQTASKLNKISSTPTYDPSILADVLAWKNQTNIDSPTVASSSQITTEILDAIVQAEPPIAASPIAASPIQTTTDILETASQSGSVIEDSPILNNREVQIFNSNND
jgi:hypothetical protein